jgi:hypothetical protein
MGAQTLACDGATGKARFTINPARARPGSPGKFLSNPALTVRMILFILAIDLMRSENPVSGLVETAGL